MKNLIDVLVEFNCFEMNNDALKKTMNYHLHRDKIKRAFGDVLNHQV